MCALQGTNATQNFCALICVPKAYGGKPGQCGASSSCKDIDYGPVPLIGLCTYDA